MRVDGFEAEFADAGRVDDVSVAGQAVQFGMCRGVSALVRGIRDFGDARLRAGQHGADQRGLADAGVSDEDGGLAGERLA